MVPGCRKERPRGVGIACVCVRLYIYRDTAREETRGDPWRTRKGLFLSLSLLPPIASEPVEGEERGKKGKRRKKVEEREERSYRLAWVVREGEEREKRAEDDFF